MVGSDGLPNPAYVRFFSDLTARLGGTVGPTVREVVVTVETAQQTADDATDALNDAGQSPVAVEVATDALNDAWQSPVAVEMVAAVERLTSDIEELRGLVMGLALALNGMNQGSIQ